MKDHSDGDSEPLLIKLSRIQSEQGTIQRQLDRLDAKLENSADMQGALHIFIFGVEKQGGLSRIVELLEKDVRELHRWKSYVLGIATILSIVFGFIGSKLSQLIFGGK